MRRRQVLVAGAGLVGLSAAQSLQQAGHEVLVLEPRERMGGRIRTSQRWADAPLDLGATWIHGVQGNPLNAIVHNISAPMGRPNRPLVQRFVRAWSLFI